MNRLSFSRRPDSDEWDPFGVGEMQAEQRKKNRSDMLYHWSFGLLGGNYQSDSDLFAKMRVELTPELSRILLCTSARGAITAAQAADISRQVLEDLGVDRVTDVELGRQALKKRLDNMKLERPESYEQFRLGVEIRDGVSKARSHKPTLTLAGRIKTKQQ